jgi:hypothetical protein
MSQLSRPLQLEPPELFVVASVWENRVLSASVHDIH